MRKQYRWRMLMAAALAGVLLAAAGCGGGPDGGGSPGDQKQVIRLGDMQWQSLWINNAIAGFIIEKGYGYPVETVEVTTPIMQLSLVRGDLDVAMEIWTGNMVDWYNEVIEKGQMLDLGKVMDRTTQGWYVPAYVVHGDPERGIAPMAPDLRTVEDLKRYAHLFADPEDPGKGRLISCITGWDCANVNRVKLHAYGLADLYNLQEPGTSGALDAAIAGAYQRGEPLLTYYWEPTWLMGALDMVLLEEPPYSEECWALVRKGVAGDIPLNQIPPEAGCAWEDAPVVKGVHPSLKERAPEVVAFLERFMIPTEDLNKISAYMEENDVEADQAALWFFANYQELWRSWMPDDVAKKVEQALLAAGVSL
ncbi:MAG: ABC transporter substrate-binding protein [Bacillota bacterium]|nr:MAG: ABC transporter substrate-binding protein [Bacillota bacterium]